MNRIADCTDAGCVCITLQLQTDHQQDRAGATSGKTGAELQ